MNTKLKSKILIGFMIFIMASLLGVYWSKSQLTNKPTNIGIIGSSDGPTSIYVTSGNETELLLLFLCLVVIIIISIIKYKKMR